MSIFAVSASLPAVPLAVAEPIEAVSGLRVLRSDASGVLLELATPDYALVPIQADGHAFESLSVVGLNLTAEAGQPQLPMASALLGVPPDATVTVRVMADDGQLLSGRHDLIPAASPVPLMDELQSGQTRRTVDAKAYAGTAAYPALMARLADDAWLRDQRLVRVEMYPFQYRPRDRQVIWHRTLRVE
ncbi:MAG TPA: C25 family peptidase propeptide domain-containing protein, partial [Anaerolineae bacterium]|nr:C25 family peptidase propeptide domain-containing protein [Anaerolineae bacterium]